MVRLFVYGSLRAGQYNHALYLKNNSRFISYGHVKGALYTLRGAAYPALLLEEGMTLGEIYEVEEACAKRIDALEGYVEGKTDNEYERVLCDIYDDKGEMIGRLPLYVYNLRKKGNAERLEHLIVHGDFCRYLKETAAEKEKL